MRKKCTDKIIGKFLSQHLAKTLNGRHRKQFEFHLFQCASCRQLVKKAEADAKTRAAIEKIGREAFREMARAAEEL